jgi:hypothetical protein
MAAPHGFGTAWIKDDGPTKIAMTFDEAVQPVRGGFLACIVVMDDLVSGLEPRCLCSGTEICSPRSRPLELISLGSSMKLLSSGK